MSSNQLAPIIIKRKKVIAGGGHHGGAWKVAYADFVTAMMAFFMLMWLLNATTETQRKGLADYFSPTIAVARVSGGGDGAFGGDNFFTESTLAQSGRGGFTNAPAASQREAGSSGVNDKNAEAEQLELEQAIAGVIGSGGESLVADSVLEHVTTRLTDEGLVVEIFDLEGRPLFDGNTAIPTPLMSEIAGLMVEVFDIVTNRVSIASHVAAYPVVRQENPAWSLTTERAQATRSLLEASGLAADRMERLVGFGQQKPALDDQMDVRNNRIVFTLLRDGQ